MEDGKVDQRGGGWRYHHQSLTEQRCCARRHDGLLGLSPLALHLLVLDGVVMEVAHEVHGLLGGECDEAKAPVSFSDLVHQHYSIIHASYNISITILYCTVLYCVHRIG